MAANVIQEEHIQSAPKLGRKTAPVDYVVKCNAKNSNKQKCFPKALASFEGFCDKCEHKSSGTKRKKNCTVTSAHTKQNANILKLCTWKNTNAEKNCL